MSFQLVRQGIRLRADERRRGPLLDMYTNATPQGWVRAATQFEVALARGGVLADVSNLSSVTLQASPDADRDGTRAFSRTLAGSALDRSLTEATWADGSKQHALFTFSSAEMNLALGGAAAAEFWIVITALTLAGDPLVCGSGRMVMVDDGAFAAASPPPVNPGAALTSAQADARYAQPAGVLNFAAGVTGTSGGGSANLDGVLTAGLPDHYVLVMREAGLGLTGWVLEPDGEAVGGARVVVPGDHGGGERAVVAGEAVGRERERRKFTQSRQAAKEEAEAEGEGRGSGSFPSKCVPKREPGNEGEEAGAWERGIREARECLGEASLPFYDRPLKRPDRRFFL